MKKGARIATRALPYYPRKLSREFFSSRGHETAEAGGTCDDQNPRRRFRNGFNEAKVHVNRNQRAAIQARGQPLAVVSSHRRGTNEKTRKRVLADGMQTRIVVFHPGAVPGRGVAVRVSDQREGIE